MRECNVISELGLKFMLYLQKTTGMDLFKGVKTLYFLIIIILQKFITIIDSSVLNSP